MNLDPNLQPMLKHCSFDLQGRPANPYSDESRAAMRLLEAMIDDGQIALAPDMWLDGKLRFLPPHIAARNLKKAAA